MRTYDISVAINAQLPVWPGDPAVSIQQAVSMAAGDLYNLSYLNISAHTGTHIDAPLHFLHQGKPIGDIPLEHLVGPAQVVAIADDIRYIDADVIKQAGIVPGAKKILFKTINSILWGKSSQFFENYTALNTSGAQALVDLGVHLIGIDYLSVSVFDDTIKPHILLLSQDIVLLEGCDLSAVEPGAYELICLPLKLNEIEGSPARAILRRPD